jgi:hypothetical protein
VKKIVLCLNDAPGTGRTTACELVQAAWRQKGLGHSRWHTSADQPVGPGRSRYVDLGSRLSEDEIIGWLDQASLVMVDVATGDAASLVESYVRSDLPEILAEMDCTVTLMTVLNGQIRAEQSLLQLAGQLRDDAEYVVFRRESADAGWQLPACQRAMHHLGAIEVTLPDLPEVLADAAATEGTHCIEWMAREAALSRVAQSWLRSWWLEADRCLEAAADLLWPDDLDPCEFSTALSMGSRGRRAGKKAASA